MNVISHENLTWILLEFVEGRTGADIRGCLPSFCWVSFLMSDMKVFISWTMDEGELCCYGVWATSILLHRG